VTNSETAFKFKRLITLMPGGIIGPFKQSVMLLILIFPVAYFRLLRAYGDKSCPASVPDTETTGSEVMNGEEGDEEGECGEEEPGMDAGEDVSECPGGPGVHQDTEQARTDMEDLTLTEPEGEKEDKDDKEEEEEEKEEEMNPDDQISPQGKSTRLVFLFARFICLFLSVCMFVGVLS